MRLVTEKIRTATPHFFEKSGIRRNKVQKQHPFIVVTTKNKKIKVEVVYSCRELMKFPKRAKVLAQWEGKTRSDYYRFSIKELKEHIENNPKKTTQEI